MFTYRKQIAKALTLSLILSTVAPSAVALAGAEAAIPNTLPKDCPPMRQETVLKTSLLLGIILCAARLYTKKTNPKVAYPKDNSLLEQLRYLVDEKFIGMLGKPERADSVDLNTGKFHFSKVEARGLMGQSCTYLKDTWVPIISIISVWKGFFEKTVKDACNDAGKLLQIDEKELPSVQKYILAFVAVAIGTSLAYNTFKDSFTTKDGDKDAETETATA